MADPLAAARPHRPQRKPAAVRSSAPARRAPRPQGLRRQPGGGTIDEALLPRGAGAVGAQRDAAAAVRRGDPARRRAGERAPAQPPFPGAQRLSGNQRPGRVPQAPVGDPRGVRAAGPEPGPERGARRHRARADRVASADRRRLPPGTGPHRPVHAAAAQPARAVLATAPHETLRHPRQVPARVRPHHRHDAVRPVPYLHRRRAHPAGDQEHAAPALRRPARRIPGGLRGVLPAAQARAAVRGRALPRHRQGPRRRPLRAGRRRRHRLLSAPRPHQLGRQAGGLAGAQPPDHERHRPAQGHFRPGRGA